MNASDTISASYQTTQKVTVKNLNFIGNNYYWIIYVPENQTYKVIIVEYNNITYTGPQICFHPNRLTRFINCNITIKDTDLTTGTEVAECNQIEIGENTSITHTSKSNSSFWFRNANPSLKILENSNVVFESTYRELFYGTNELTLTILDAASFKVTTQNSMAYGTFGTKNTILNPKSSFIIKQKIKNRSYTTWYSYGTWKYFNKSHNYTFLNTHE